MGSFLSQPSEPAKVVVPPEAASSAKPAPITASREPTSPAQDSPFKNCWSCRVLSGSGLIGAGGYVYWVARKPLKLGYSPSPGTIAQMVFGISESLGTTLGHGEWGREAHPRGRAPGLVTWGETLPNLPVRCGAGRSYWDVFFFFSS